MLETSFRPSVHGWPFPNAFSASGSGLGLGAPLSARLGLSAGMCWAALDRYLAGRRIPRDLGAPAPEEPLYQELVLRQASALAQGVWRKALAWQQRPDRRGLVGRAGLVELAWSEWRRMRRTLDAGEPVLVCLLRASGPLANPSENYAALACRYRRDRKTGEISIWLYDPNQPGEDNLRVVLKGRWRGPRVDGPLVDGRAVRGFFAVPYDRPRPLRLIARAFGEAAAGLVGTPHVVAARGRLRVLARSAAAELLVWERDREGSWRPRDPGRHRRAVTEYPLAGTPAVAAGPVGSYSVYTRNTVGDVLAYRWFPVRGWTAANPTESRRAGVGFRIAGDPVVVLARGLRQVLCGRNREGHLIIYEAVAGRWSAEDVTEAAAPAHLLAGQPAGGAEADGRQHVFGRNFAGELVHYQRTKAEGWRAAPLAAPVSGDRALRLAGDPISVVDDAGALHAFARAESGEIVHYSRGKTGSWAGHSLSESAPSPEALRAASEPVAVRGPGAELHLFARGSAGALLHFRRIGAEWVAENVTAGRATLGERCAIDGAPAAARARTAELVVAGRRGGDVVLYRWLPETDWTVELLFEEHPGLRRVEASDPAVLIESDGRVHVFAAASDGSMLEWQPEPKRPSRMAELLRRLARKWRRPAVAAPVPAPRRAAAAEPARSAAVTPEPREHVAAAGAAPRAEDTDLWREPRPRPISREPVAPAVEVPAATETAAQAAAPEPLAAATEMAAQAAAEPLAGAPRIDFASIPTFDFTGLEEPAPAKDETPTPPTEPPPVTFELAGRAQLAPRAFEPSAAMESPSLSLESSALPEAPAPSLPDLSSMIAGLDLTFAAAGAPPVPAAPEPEPVPPESRASEMAAAEPVVPEPAAPEPVPVEPEPAAPEATAEPVAPEPITPAPTEGAPPAPAAAEATPMPVAEPTSPQKPEPEPLRVETGGPLDGLPILYMPERGPISRKPRPELEPEPPPKNVAQPKKPGKSGGKGQR